MANQQQLFELLESEDVNNLKEGLELLKNEPKLLEAAQKRYLPLIRARLNDATASIWDLEKAVLSSQEVDFIISKLGNQFFSLESLNTEESDLLVQVLGAALASVTDINDILETMHQWTEDGFYESSMETIGLLMDEIYTALDESSKQGPYNGWYRRVLRKLMDDHCLESIQLNHTALSTWRHDTSIVRYFMLSLTYMSFHGGAGGLSLDIAQSDTPQLTPIFWLFYYHTKISLVDSTVDIPLSPLSFSRCFEIQNQGDAGSWSTIVEKYSSPELLKIEDSIGYKQIKTQ